MRVVMAAPGTRGDVAPIAGLAARIRAAGHEATIVADEPYRALVAGSGSNFVPIPADLRVLTAGDGTRSAVSPGVIREQLRRLRAYMDDAASAVLRAADDADVVLANSVSPFAHDIAEGLGIPSFGTFLQPVEPSGDYPPVLLGTHRGFGRAGNRLLGLMMREVGAPADHACARMRSELGLPRESRRASERRRRRNGMRVFHGISPAVFPRPSDWRAELCLDGYWWPLRPSEWTAPAELVDFLQAGPRPVFIGFGSTSPGSNAVGTAVRAARRAGLRACVQGAADASDGGETEPGDDVLVVGDVPHDWLFDRVAAVVHHAGAGTTAAGLRAGTPTVAMPQSTDQPLWGRRIAALGAGPEPIRAKKVTETRLADAIADAVGNRAYRDGAARVASRIAADDGGAGVLTELDRLA